MGIYGPRHFSEEADRLSPRAPTPRQANRGPVDCLGDLGLWEGGTLPIL